MKADELIWSLQQWLGPGQELVISHLDFTETFCSGWPSMYETPEQSFLSKMVGSAWGSWTVRRNAETGDFIVRKGLRYEYDENYRLDRRVYVEPDRDHLFEKTQDGYFILRQKVGTDDLCKS